MTGDTEMSTHDLNEVRIALGGPDGGHVADEPKQEARDPKAQTDAECSRERAVDDGDGARRTAHQDRFGQRAMHGRDEVWDFCIHQITTPPPNEKNDRKKLDAANAIDRPNTIWMSLRNPPEVSPNASESPVTRASSARRRSAPRPERTAMTSMVSAISARGTVTTASWISCSSRRTAPSAVPAWMVPIPPG